MADYIRFDKDGKITNKYPSVDGSDLTGDDIMKVDRETLDSITRYHKVKDKKIIRITKEEEDALVLAETDTIRQKEIDRIDNLEISTKDLADVLVELGIVDKIALTDNIKAKSLIINPPPPPPEPEPMEPII